ncbi:2156_t:CDS:2 [Gigaspora margarita]|uniref:2156_t:CDS:1 n=1 Tax=Gigaspora margarita TaxID=4874 RepID=A0ABN7W0I5_GIGMA|nr:2156_t:CDS:2 [Gigaspora margarita]
MYSILSQEEGSSTKESWDYIVSQYESYLQANMSIQEINNGQNNNKEHMIEFNSKSLGSSQYGSTNTRHLMTNEDPLKTNLQVNKDQNTKSEALLQISSSLTQSLASDITQNVWSEVINIDTTNQKKITINTVINIEQTTPPSTPNSLITEQDLHDELIMDDPFSRQNSEKDTSTKSGDIVIENNRK